MADVVTATSYYPFGMAMPDRSGKTYSGTWVPSRGFTDGGLYPTDLSIAQRYAPRPSNYVATRQIELLPGFETSLTDEMIAEIINPTDNPNGSTETYGGEGSYEAYGYYRYGFNGKENDNEVKGVGNQQDYGMRIYDPRLGRFLSVDPLYRRFPFYSPYHFAGNSPILNIDLDGAEPHNPNQGIYSDAPEQKHNPVLLNRNDYKVDPVTGFGIGILKSVYNFGLGALGIATNVPAAAHIGDKISKDKWANVFPALPNNNAFKDILVPLAVTTIEITKALSEDPTNPELWGEAAVKVFAYSRMSGTKSARVNDIALGLNILDGTGGSLRKFANKSFSIEQSEWGNGFFKLNRNITFIENFKNVAAFVVDNGGRIKFDLTKFDWEKASSQIGKDPYTTAGGMTVAEMEHIMGNKKLLDGTDFYEKGKKANKQDVIDKFNKAKNK